MPRTPKIIQETTGRLKRSTKAKLFKQKRLTLTQTKMIHYLGPSSLLQNSTFQKIFKIYLLFSFKFHLIINYQLFKSKK